MTVRTLLVFSICTAAFAAEIPKGAHVLLRMMNSVSTRTAREGDFVYLQTAVPVAAGGQIILPANSYVQGVVSHAKRSGRVGGRAELGIRLETVTLPGGKAFKFAPRVTSVDAGEGGQQVDAHESTVKEGGSKGQDVQRIAITAGTGAALGAMVDRGWRGAGIGAGAGTAVGLATVLLTRGREVELRQGTTLDVVFDRAVAVE